MWYYQEQQAQLEARMGGPPARVFFFDCAEGTMVGRLLARCADTAILARADDLRPRADANEAAALRMMEGFVSATLPVIDVYDQAGLVTVLSTGDERSPAKAYDEFERTLAAALPQAGPQERQRQMDQELAQRAHQEQANPSPGESRPACQLPHRHEARPSSLQHFCPSRAVQLY